MAVFEMPIEQLQTYRGTNPCPADFDTYWEKALEEMRATEPAVTLAPADFTCPFAECFDLFFTGVRGARIYAKFARPQRAAGKLPAVLIFHGYSANSGDWTGLLPYAAAGFAVAALDCRGQGGRSEDTGGVKGNTLHGQVVRGLDDLPENMLMRHIFLDTAELARIVMDMPEVDADRVGAFGGSQGGGLTLACAALEPRIRRLAPQMPFLSDYERVWKMDLAKQAFEEITLYFRRFDPQHKREREVFTRLGYIDVQHLAPRIRGEVMMLTGLMDTVCPPSTQFAAYNKISAPKQMLIYPDYAHEGYPGGPDQTFRFMLGLRETAG